MTPQPKAGSRLRPATVGVSRGGNPAVEDVRKRDRKACSIATVVTIGAVKAGELLVDKHPDRARRVKDQSQTRHGAGKGQHPNGGPAALTVRHYCERGHKTPIQVSRFQTPWPLHRETGLGNRRKRAFLFIGFFPAIDFNIEAHYINHIGCCFIDSVRDMA